MIVRSEETIVMIGGAVVAKRLLDRALQLATKVVAVDRGADIALSHSLIPEAVIGDFDSISSQARDKLAPETLHHIAEQDSTDFDKALRNVEAPLVIGVGFSGERIDHQLACYNSLSRYPRNRCVLLGQKDLVFLAPPTLQLDLEESTPVSLFPLGAVEGISDGLRWPIGGLNFAPDGQIGTSNMAEGAVEISVTSPKMLVILPNTQLELVVDALLNNLSRW